jgi:hypothetical protein
MRRYFSEQLQLIVAKAKEQSTPQPFAYTAMEQRNTKFHTNGATHRATQRSQNSFVRCKILHI